MLSTSRTTRPGPDGTGGRIAVAVHAPDPILREGVRGQLRRYPEVDLREDGDPAPGIVVLLVDDVLDETALTRLRRLVRTEGVRAVLVVRSLRESELLEVIGCGVGAVVWRHEATAPRLLQAVRAAARGDGDLPADLLGRLINQVGTLHRTAADGSRAGAAPGLTQREVDVLRLVAEGFDTAEIAAKLSYSERTVKNVMHGLTTRLRLRNRAHAVAHALREGYI